MGSSQQRTGDTRSDGTREARIVAGILGVVIAVSVGTFWARAGEPEAMTARSAAAAAAAVEPRAPAAIPAPAEGEVFHADVYFDLKSTRLRADAVRVLQERAALMEGEPGWAVLVQGHADLLGPAEYNRALALRRAEAVKRFLVELGVPEAAVRVVAVGQDGALCDDPGPDCQRLNRRVHIEMRRLPAAVSELAPLRPAIVEGDVIDVGATATSSASPATDR